MLSPDTMRRIDLYVGVPICFLLSVWYGLLRVVGLKNPRYEQKPKNILFIELAEMGSTILAIPAMREIKKQFPEAKIHFLLFKHIKSSMDIVGEVPDERIYTIEVSNVFTLAKDVLKFMIAARKNKIDATLNLEMFARFSAILSYLSGAQKRVGFHRFHQEGLYIGSFLTHKVMYNPHIHTAQSFIALARALNALPNQIPLVKVAVDKDDLSIPHRDAPQHAKEHIWKKLTEEYSGFSKDKTLILVNPNASKLISIRKWPLHNYALLVSKLLEDENVVVAITGVASEKPDAQYIVQHVRNERVIDMAGKTTLPELIDLYSCAKLLITNDSGPAHFASLTNVHIMVFFGPETPKLYKPLTDRSTILYSHFACSPCVSAYNQRMSPCNDNQCLKALGVDYVYQQAQKVLTRQ